MASIIDLYCQQPLFLSKKYFGSTKIQRQHKLPSFLYPFLQKCRNNHQQFVINRTQTSNLKLMMQVDLIPKFSTLFTLSVNKSTNIFHFNSCYIQQHHFLTVQSSKMRHNFCRTLQRFNNQMNSQQINITVNMINGKIKIDKLSLIESYQKDLSLIWKQWRSFYRTVSMVTANHLEYLIENINQSDTYTSLLQNKFCNQHIKEEYKKIMDIRENIAISHLNFENFSKQNKNYSYEMSQIQNFIINRDSLINIFKQNKQIIGTEQRIYSFCFEDEYFKSKPKSIEYMKNRFANEFRDYVTNPVIRQLPGDNSFGYNQITIKNETEVNNIDIGLEGGNGKINVAKIQFKYLRNTVIKSTQNEQKFISKLVAIKIPKQDQITGKLKGVEKIHHEMKIVQNFKNSSSAYILKYYRSNQPAFKFKDNLLMDYLSNANTLIQYLQNKKQTLSLSSKLHILLHLANALQFLEKHQIVHMDISLSNIIIIKDLLIKIIDFGQAYHPNICKKDYKPAYTLPFSPPQTFRKSKQFTSKQDIFSFGIIAYRLLFDSYPSFITDQLEESYAKGSYMQKFYLAPEKSSDFGNINIMEMLTNLISRCMSPNQKQRPTPFWICIIIKKIFFSIK